MDYNREKGTVTFIYNVLDLEKDDYYEELHDLYRWKQTNIYFISNHKNVMSLIR